ncbi:MAG: hypothetical protein WC477_02720 [Patescibacteria group bacterium]
MYANIVVKDKKALPVLRFPLSLLEEKRPNSHTPSNEYANYPPPANIALHIRKNSRPRNAHEREFLAWCVAPELNRATILFTDDQK